MFFNVSNNLISLLFIVYKVYKVRKVYKVSIPYNLMDFINFINSFVSYYKTTTEPPAASMASTAFLENAFALTSSLAVIAPSAKIFTK